MPRFDTMTLDSALTLADMAANVETAEVVAKVRTKTGWEAFLDSDGLVTVSKPNGHSYYVSEDRIPLRSILNREMKAARV